MNICLNRLRRIKEGYHQRLKMFWVTFDFESTYIDCFTVTLAALSQDAKATSNLLYHNAIRQLTVKACHQNGWKTVQCS